MLKLYFELDLYRFIKVNLLKFNRNAIHFDNG